MSRGVDLTVRGRTGGRVGIPGLRSFAGPPAGGLLHRQAVYVVVVVIVVVSVAAMYQVCERTSAGQAFRAIREDEVLAQTLGIDTTRYKLLAFTLSSAFAGLAGGLYAYYVQLVNPVIAGAATTSLVIGMGVFGGLGTLWGPALGGPRAYGLFQGLGFGVGAC